MEIHFVNTKKMVEQFLAYQKTVDRTLPPKTKVHIIPNTKGDLQMFCGYVTRMWRKKVIE